MATPSSLLDHVNLLPLQHLYQTYQRQPDQRIGIVTVQPLKQRNAQTFRLETACAVIGLLAAKIVFDLHVGQLAEHDRERFDHHLAVTGSAVEEGEASQECDAL